MKTHNRSKEDVCQEMKEFYEKNPFPPETHYNPDAHAWIIKSIPKSYNLLGKSIAEIGCGTGHMSCFLSKFGKVEGYDFSGNAIKIAKLLADKEKISNVNFEVDDITEVKERKQYDAIFSIGAIHIIPNQAQAIENIKKMMKPDSLFIVGVYNKYAYANPLWRLRIQKNRYPDTFEVPYENFYGKNEFKKILESYGLKVIGIYNDCPDILRLLTARGLIVTYCCMRNI
jgi:2-polyprenyl-3-methyl-5-hydroxy-6-metoxy-1,4-benzoquinol methylase